MDRLVARLKAIPEGQCAETARRAGIGYRQLMRLRQGKSPDIRISTLERLARGMETTMADLLGEASLDERAALSLSAAKREVEAERDRLQHALTSVAEAVSEAVEQAGRGQR